MNRHEAQEAGRYAFDYWSHAKHQGFMHMNFQEYLVHTLYEAFAKELQDMAYSTYEYNVEVSLNKDMIDRWHSNTNKDWS